MFNLLVYFPNVKCLSTSSDLVWSQLYIPTSIRLHLSSRWWIKGLCHNPTGMSRQLGLLNHLVLFFRHLKYIFFAYRDMFSNNCIDGQFNDLLVLVYFYCRIFVSFIGLSFFFVAKISKIPPKKKRKKILFQLQVGHGNSMKILQEYKSL